MDIKLLMAWALLLVFGYLYNRFVGKMENRVLIEGYRAVLVVFGVSVTLIVALPFIGFFHAAIVVSCFIASGVFMIAGDIKRYLDVKKEGDKFWGDIIDDARNGK